MGVTVPPVRHRHPGCPTDEREDGRDVVNILHWKQVLSFPPSKELSSLRWQLRLVEGIVPLGPMWCHLGVRNMHLLWKTRWKFIEYQPSGSVEL